MGLKKSTAVYKKWQLNHNCQTNHEKSLGDVGSVGLGNGDNKVKDDSRRKHNVTLRKVECIGHAQPCKITQMYKNITCSKKKTHE